MSLRNAGSGRVLNIAALFALAGSFLSGTALAQQVTYYDFDVPQSTAGQMSRSCPSSAAPAGTLFCFNDGTGQNANPTFLSDTYPLTIDPVTTDNPPVSSSHFAIQMTGPQLTQQSSSWFAVPQKVSEGFNAYFAVKFTPDPNAFATADGVAFVIQNSAGGSTASGCTAIGAGLSIVGGPGGCIGYGGIDNSIAFELDTYRNYWDPNDNGGSNDDNHVAIMNCGAGLPNSPDHTSSCQVSLNLNGVNVPAIIDPPGVNLADGNVHQVVIIYNGPTETNPNLLQVFIDPPFVPGTYTPASPTAGLVLSGVYNIAANLNLMNSGTANDSAYIGFTSATGGGDEQHEVMAWTYTPHTPSTQQQPISPPGSPTVLPFGSHVLAVTYPPGTPPPPAGTDLIVTATPISPQLFSLLIANGPYAGSQCQVYDDTGGNCIVYSASCVDTATNTFVQCPAAPADNPITVKTAFDNTIQPISPGFLEGDPFYSPVTSITGDGTTATVTCPGDCSVAPGQTVSVVGNSVVGFNTTVTVASASPSAPSTFTFLSPVSGTGTGGYLNSNNEQNIFVSYTPQRIDGSISGRTLNFNSDFVATSVTTVPTMLSITAPSVPYGSTAVVTIKATSANGTPTGKVSMTVDGVKEPNAVLTNGVATYKLTGLTGGTHALAVTYATTGTFQANTATGSITITQIAQTVSISGITPTTRLQYQQPITITANTTETPVPVVSFGTTGSCAIVPNGTNSPQLVASQSSGICTVTAQFPGNASYLPASTSASVNIGYTAVTVALASSINPSAVGQPVIFTITATGDPAEPEPTAPTGTVTIGGSSVSCAATLKATGASTAAGSCSISFPGPGSYSLAPTLYSNLAPGYVYQPSGSPLLQSVGTAATASIFPTSLPLQTGFLGQGGGATVTLTNNGSTNMSVGTPYLSNIGSGNTSTFTLLNLCPSSLSVGQSCGIYVNYMPIVGVATDSATLNIIDGASNSPQTVPITAKSVAPPPPVTFGSLTVGLSATQLVTLTNNSTNGVNISGISITGAYASQFSQTNNCPTNLAGGASCKVTVNFAPTVVGSFTSYLLINDNVGVGFQQIMVSGTSVARQP